MESLKKVVTCLLMAFIVFAVVSKIVSRNVPQEAPAIQGEHLVLLFHAGVRCPTCNTMESYVEEALENRGDLGSRLKLVLLEYDSQKNKELVDRFHVGTASVILAEQKDGKIVRSYDFTPEAWHWIDYKNRFIDALDTQLTDFFSDKVSRE